jgi:hypothetical protein
MQAGDYRQQIIREDLHHHRACARMAAVLFPWRPVDPGNVR